MNKKSGFTLIELLVVVSIISILSVIGLATYQNVTARAKDAKVRADLDAIRKAYETNFDPTLNNGQGGYKKLSGSNFASGQIPTFDGKTPYILVGPDGAGLNDNSSSFLACAPINGAKGVCTAASDNCACVSSTSGSGNVTYTPPPSILLVTSSGGSNVVNLSIPTGADRILVVTTRVANDGGDCRVNSVKWNVGSTSQTLTRVGCQNASNAGSVAIWYLVNPNTGSGTIAVENQNLPITTIASSWTGVDQTTPLENRGAAQTSTGYGMDIKISNIRTTNDGVIIDGVYAHNPLVGLYAGQNNIAVAFKGSSYVKNADLPSPITSMGWTQNPGQTWAIVAISLKKTPI